MLLIEISVEASRFSMIDLSRSKTTPMKGLDPHFQLILNKGYDTGF